MVPAVAALGPKQDGRVLSLTPDRDRDRQTDDQAGDCRAGNPIDGDHRGVLTLEVVAHPHQRTRHRQRPSVSTESRSP
jgi:hypothetical protein